MHWERCAWLRCLLATCLFVSVISLQAAWEPPANPDPEKIHQEANADRDAKRYEDALAKYLWYHENALKYSKSQYGVRLSFALGDWERLADVYPAARAKMESVRDETEKKILASRDPKDLFHDYVALNKTLNQDKKTTDFFKRLDTSNPQAAWAVFDLAQADLVRAKEYRLCGKYMDPVRTYTQYLNNFKANKKMAINQEVGKELENFAEKDFETRISTLVAILSVNNRKVEAQRVAGLALKEWGDPGFARKLESAMKGRVPSQ